MAVTREETGLTPVEMLEHLILTRNLISGNIACSFDSWVQKKVPTVYDCKSAGVTHGNNRRQSTHRTSSEYRQGQPQAQADRRRHW